MVATLQTTGEGADLSSGHYEKPSARAWLEESRTALSAQAPLTPRVPCLSGFEKRAVNLKMGKKRHRAMLLVRKSCKLNCVSEWSCPALGVIVFWGMVEDGERKAVGQEGFGMGRSCQGLEEGPVLTVLVHSPYPSWCCSSTSPFF